MKVVRAGAIAVAGVLALTGTSPSRYTARQKAFYAPASTVEFVRPGLLLTIASAQIAADGTVSTIYNVSDPEGLPLDALGVNTPGPLTLHFIAAYIPNGQQQYAAYTTQITNGAATSFRRLWRAPIRAGSPPI